MKEKQLKTRKKIKIIIGVVAIITLIIISAFLFTGCSFNQSLMDFDYGFDRALVYEDGEWNEYKVEKWDDYENDMLCIWTTDGQIIYTSSNNIILYGKK